MSDVTQEAEGREDGSTPAVAFDELSLLKQRADIMGIKYHPNIGIKKLKDMIEEKKEAPVTPVVYDPYAGEEAATIQAAQAAGDTFTQPQRETTTQVNMRLRQEALKLVRIRVTNMNPLMGNLKGEIVSVGNAQIGFIKKYVPYNAEAGWHVPQIVLNQLQQKKFMTHYEVKVGNKKIKKHRLVPELAIEILPPLTAKELQDLKQRQLMAAGQ